MVLFFISHLSGSRTSFLAPVVMITQQRENQVVKQIVRVDDRTDVDIDIVVVAVVSAAGDSDVRQRDAGIGGQFGAAVCYPTNDGGIINSLARDEVGYGTSGIHRLRSSFLKRNAVLFANRARRTHLRFAAVSGHDG